MSNNPALDRKMKKNQNPHQFPLAFSQPSIAHRHARTSPVSPIQPYGRNNNGRSSLSCNLPRSSRSYVSRTRPPCHSRTAASTTGRPGTSTRCTRNRRTLYSTATERARMCVGKARGTTTGVRGCIPWWSRLRLFTSQPKPTP